MFIPTINSLFPLIVLLISLVVRYIHISPFISVYLSFVTFFSVLSSYGNLIHFLCSSLNLYLTFLVRLFFSSCIPPSPRSSACFHLRILPLLSITNITKIQNKMQPAPFVSVHIREAHMSYRVIAPPIIFSTLVRCEVLNSRPGCSPPGKELRYPLSGKKGGT